MAIPVVGGAAKLRVRYVWKNGVQYGLCVNSYYCYAVSGAPTSLADVAKGLDAALSAQMISLVPVEVQYWGIGAAIMQASIPHQATPEYYNAFSRAPGAAVGHELPSQSSTLVSLRTDVQGRAGRGRMYIPFPPTSAIDVDASLKAAWKDEVNGFVTDSNDITISNSGLDGTVSIRRVVQSRIWSGAGFDVARWIIRNYMATQRRRAEVNRPDNDPFSGSIGPS